MANTDWQAAATALRGAFKAQWEARAPGVLIEYRNGPELDKPDPTKDAWVRFSVLNGPSRHPVIGNRRSRDLARVDVQIFTPIRQGDGRSRELGDTVREIWDTTSLPDISIGAPEFIPGGVDSKLPFWVDTVSTPFTVDRHTA